MMGMSLFFKAKDTGVGLVEVARIAGATDPYFSMGGSQQVKFYNSGAVDFGSVAVSNVGAAGNDFGATNSLIVTEFSDGVTIKEAGGQDSLILNRTSDAAMRIAFYDIDVDYWNLGMNSNAEGDEFYLWDTIRGGRVFGIDSNVQSFEFDVPVNMQNNALTNVGAAGNDFGATNSLVATTFSGTVTPGTANTYNLGSTSLEWANLYIGTGKVYFYTDQGESIYSTSSSLKFSVNAADRFTMYTTSFSPVAADTYGLGSTAYEWLNLYIGDAGGAFFGLDQDAKLAWNNGSVWFAVTTSDGVGGYANRMVFGSGAAEGSSSINIYEPTNFNSKTVSNLGAAGNDFNASDNYLIRTTFSGDVNPNADGTLDLGTQTTAQWANVWSDLINGAEFTMMNKWRIMESELYAGYPAGFAFGYSDKWVDGVSIWHSEDREQYMKDEKPLFAVTDDFMEYKGYRYNPEHFIPRDEVEDLVERKVMEKLSELESAVPVNLEAIIDRLVGERLDKKLKELGLI